MRIVIFPHFRSDIVTVLKPRSSIWDYAWNEIDKPDAITQVKHSSSYRAARKIFSTKAGAIAALRDAAQQGAALIPLPVVGTIVSNLIGKIHAAGRKARLDKRLKDAKADGDLRTQMKFMLKTIDTGVLREHVKKATEAFTIMEDGIKGHKAHVDYARKHNAVCPELLKRAKQILYTRKHLTRLEHEAADLMECARLLAEYSRQLNEITAQYQQRYLKLWGDNIPKTFPDGMDYEVNPWHANCLDNGYCVVTTQKGGAQQVLPSALKTGVKMVFTSGATVSVARQTGSYIAG